MTFQHYDQSEDLVNGCVETLEFVSNMVEGDVTDPFTLTLAGDTVELVIDFSTNWNWFSINVVQDNMDVSTVLENSPAQAGDNIKSQTTAAIYYDGFGFYPTFDIDAKNLYQLKLAEAGTMVYEGTPVDPSTPIPLLSNWNWIGYIPQTPLDVTVATASSPAQAGDYMKSQTTAATYYDGFGFYPTFDMVPTGGYMLNVANPGDLVYPSGSLASYIQGANDDESYYRKYEFNGSISASVDIDNVMIDENDILYAYSDGHLRGKISPMVFPLTGDLVFSLMVYGDGLEDEKLNFELYDNETGKYYALNQELLFSKDMIIGDAYNTFNLKGLSSELPVAFKLLPAYPNPFNPTTNISFITEIEGNLKLSIYDIRGREIDVLVNGFQGIGEQTIIWDAADFASGIYYIHITAGNHVETQKIMLIK